MESLYQKIISSANLMQTALNKISKLMDVKKTPDGYITLKDGSTISKDSYDKMLKAAMNEKYGLLGYQAKLGIDTIAGTIKLEDVMLELIKSDYYDKIKEMLEGITLVCDRQGYRPIKNTTKEECYKILHEIQMMMGVNTEYNAKIKEYVDNDSQVLMDAYKEGVDHEN